MSDNVRAPEEVIAAWFMQRKGFPDLEPTAVRRPGTYEWIFIYNVDNGRLELLVRWDEAARDWTTRVVDFSVAGR